MRPDGIYRAKAVEHEWGESNKGTPQVGVRFAFTDEVGGYITWYGYLSEASAARTIESLRHCGWSGADFTDMSGLCDKEVELVLETTEYEGKSSQKVAWVNKSGIAMTNRMSPDKLKAFAASMKGFVLSVDRDMGSPKPQDQKSRPAPAGDIPF
jgi:hypothetical protein